MSSTVNLTIQSTIRGFVYGSSVSGTSVSAQQYKTTFSSSYAGFINRQGFVEVTTAQATAVNLGIATSATGALLIPDTTFTGLWNITASTAQVGIALQGPSPAIVATSVALRAYTTTPRPFSLQVISI